MSVFLFSYIAGRIRSGLVLRDYAVPELPFWLYQALYILLDSLLRSIK